MNYKPIVVSVVSIGLFVISYHYGNQIALKPYSSRLMIASASSANHKLPDSNDKSAITNRSSTSNKNSHSKPSVEQSINTHDDNSKHTAINNNTNSVDGNKSATSRYFKTGLNGKTPLDQKIISECIYQHHLSYSSHDIHNIKKLMSIKHLTVKQSVKQYFENK